MLITNTITKKHLEIIVRDTFLKFGMFFSSSLLDSLKLLGFYYATNAGISINIEDLKTPDVKKKFIKIANDQVDQVSFDWQQGIVSDTERFQTIIDSWNLASESLKNRIIDYYKIFDPANNLYIMAYSGARGNMDQVRQLVGMRGLMSDQEGKIIDLPIQTNFREGLSSIDYIISSYGARKGIVDTALKTADSGYLTRRLIYVAQDLVIREIDCKTKEGILVLFNKKIKTENLFGRNLLNVRINDYPYLKINEENLTIDKEIIDNLKIYSPLLLTIRSPLTCLSNNSICQKCYGWDLSKEKLISLGEAVGIIAAQSIGEPGTQLTMRTFHTGGIFTGEILDQFTAPFSGKLILPDFLQSISFRTNQGNLVLKLQQETKFILRNWEGEELIFSLNIGSYLYKKTSCFVKKGELISENSKESLTSAKKKLKPIYTSLAGEVFFENLLVRKTKTLSEQTVLLSEDDGVLWIGAGTIFLLPKEIKYKFPKYLEKEKSFAQLKITYSIYNKFFLNTKIYPPSIIKIKDKTLEIINFKIKKVFSLKLKLVLNLFYLTKKIKDCTVKFSILVKNFQYIDFNTVLCLFEILPNIEGLIYGIKKKIYLDKSIFFFTTDSNIWKINSDQINNYSSFQKIKFIRFGTKINSNSLFSQSGIFLKKEGFQMIFQKAIPTFLSRGTILYKKQGDFVFKNEILANLVNYTQQTEDIVQGLPKIEELIEARHPKNKAFLAKKSGIYFSSFDIIDGLEKEEIEKKRKKLKDEIEEIQEEIVFFPQTKIKNSTLIVRKQSYSNFIIRKEKKKKKGENTVYIVHSSFLKQNLVLYDNQIYRYHVLPNIFELIKPEKSSTFELDDSFHPEKELDNLQKTSPLLFSELKKSKNRKVLINNNLDLSSWEKKINIANENNTIVYKYQKNGFFNEFSFTKWLNLKKINDLEEKKKDIIFEYYLNQRNDIIFQTKELDFIFLEFLHPVTSYKISSSSKLLFKQGNFIDIGEPITQGFIDVHELLHILSHYHANLDGLLHGTIKSVYKFQLLLVNSIQSIYQSQKVNISGKHIEIIVRQMTTFVIIRKNGDTPLLNGEIIKLAFINEIFKSLKKDNLSYQYKTPSYEPILLSATNSSLNKDGFLSPAGFQETKKVLTKAALHGSTDWLKGLKESIIVGRLIPAGSTFLNYKNYLDNIYLFKLKENEKKSIEIKEETNEETKLLKNDI